LPAPYQFHYPDQNYLVNNAAIDLRALELGPSDIRVNAVSPVGS
jgi:hypothetical protein